MLAASAGGAGSAGFFKTFRRTHFQIGQSGHSAENQAAKQRHEKSKREDSKINADTRKLRKLLWMNSGDNGTAPPGKRATERPAQQSQNQILDRELPNESGRFRSHGGPQSD